MELPVYVCHKAVNALKIKEVNITDIGAGVMTPYNKDYPLFGVTKDYVDKHKPEAGGYYVVYKDGYESFSPAKAFEEGYSLK